MSGAWGAGSPVNTIKKREQAEAKFLEKYTVTPDANFIIDDHPDLPGVLLVSPCSGHGFKHSAGLGEAIVQRITTGASDADLSSFRLDRFGAAV